MKSCIKVCSCHIFVTMLISVFLIPWIKYSVNLGEKDIKDLTPVRGQDGKFSDTQGKYCWSPTRLRRVDQYKSFSRERYEKKSQTP